MSIPELVNDAYTIHHQHRGKDYESISLANSSRLGFAKAGQGCTAKAKTRNEWAIVNAVEAAYVISAVANLSPIQRAWAEWAYVDENTGITPTHLSVLQQDYVVKALNEWGKQKARRESNSVLSVVTEQLKSFRQAIFTGKQFPLKEVVDRAGVASVNVYRDWNHWIEWAHTYADKLDAETRKAIHSQLSKTLFKKEEAA